MAQQNATALERFGRYPLSRTAPAAVSLGLFFVWVDVAFRISAGEFGSAPAALPQRSDLPWLTVLATAAVCSLLLWGASVVLGARAQRAASGDAAAQASQPWPLPRLAIGSLAMALGSAGYAATAILGPAALGPHAALLSAVVAGAGIPLVIGAWLRQFGQFDGEGVMVVLIQATVVSIVVMSAILLLGAVGCLVAVSLLPLAGGACCLARPKSPEAATAKPAAASAPSAPESDRRLDVRALVILLSCFIVFFLLGTIGAPATAAMRSQAFWLYDIAAAGEVVLLAATLLRFGPTRFHGALTILLATAVAFTPFLSIAGLDAACIVFLKLTTLCTYALVLMYLVDRQGQSLASGGAGTAHPPIRGARTASAAKPDGIPLRQDAPSGHAAARPLVSNASPYPMLAAVIILMLLGLVAGGMLRDVQGFSGTAFALMGVALLYAVLMVAALVFSRSRRVQVEHVITGRFDTEADIAQAQARVLAQLYPALSEREQEVLVLLLQHYSTARIAEELVVSENTVKTHVRHIYGKLQINSKQQLLALARKAAPRLEKPK